MGPSVSVIDRQTRMFVIKYIVFQVSITLSPPLMSIRMGPSVVSLWQADRQTDSQTDEQTDTDRQTDRQTQMYTYT